MITDTEARRIASEWHGGQGSALYAFASTGAIREGSDEGWDYNECAMEIYEEIAATTSYEELNPMTDMNNLLEYIQANGPRGPVPGWADLTW